VVLVGPGPSESPATPTPSVEESPAPSPSGQPTSEPTPVPSVAPLDWIGIEWSVPVTPSFTVHLADLVPWGDQYVAVGEVVEGGQSEGAFLVSPDGLNWTVTQRASSPRILVAYGNELLAFAGPDSDGLPAEGGQRIWRSTDGMSWASVDSPTWDDAWAGLMLGSTPEGWDPTQWEIQSGLVDVASGPAGLVAIGNSFAQEGMVPVVLHSTDGIQWSAVGLPADSTSPMLLSVSPYRDEFVAVGAVNVGPDETAAVAAAWFSADGTTWLSGSVEDGPLFPDGIGFEFGPLVSGADGVVTCWGSRGITVGGPRYSIAWVSADGQSWQMEPDPDASPACGWMAGDGTRMVALAPVPHPSTGQAWPGVSEAYVSLDGLTWTQITVSQTITDQVEKWWVVPDGLVYSGVQSFWFGAAITE
jgi:hypothetical protein